MYAKKQMAIEIDLGIQQNSDQFQFKYVFGCLILINRIECFKTSGLVAFEWDPWMYRSFQNFCNQRMYLVLKWVNKVKS